MDPVVSLVRLRAANGRHIGMVTRVTFADGRKVTFLERVPKREAIRQARMQLDHDH